MKHQQLDMFPESSGRLLRDDALEKVQHNAGTWFLQAMEVVQKMASAAPKRLVTGEDIRLEATALIGEPHHHNAWGAVIKFSIQAGWLKPTGGMIDMKDPRSHARQTPVYQLRQKRGPR